MPVSTQASRKIRAVQSGNSRGEERRFLNHQRFDETYY
jgi:hypothetical protein